MSFIESNPNTYFKSNSIKFKYQPIEGTMSIGTLHFTTDATTCSQLELIVNANDLKSKDSLFGMMNNTFTGMGMRLLRSSILQPLTGDGISK